VESLKDREAAHRLAGSIPALAGPILSIDTSTGAAVGLVVPGQPPLRYLSADPRRQVEDLAPLISQILGDAALSPGDLAAIAVGTGPAPYTGLRIGLATAQSLGLALRKPVIGVCSLDVLAAQALDVLPVKADDLLVATGDARRREVYWATYQVCQASADHAPYQVSNPSSHNATTQVAGDCPDETNVLISGGGVCCRRLAGPNVNRPPDLAAQLASFPTVHRAGGGCLLYPQELPLSAQAPSRPDPVMLINLAVARYQQGQPTPTRPLYLRRPDAQTPGRPKRASLPTTP
jgi:tRNA threonylcarbamoyladenosine biosynthesis protein TsaB